MQVDRRSTPAVRVHHSGLGMDVLRCGHAVSTTEKRRRTATSGWFRLAPERGYRRCVKCAMNAPADYLVPKGSR